LEVRSSKFEEEASRKKVGGSTFEVRIRVRNGPKRLEVLDLLNVERRTANREPS
jgi:hypothetical protein